MKYFYFKNSHKSLYFTNGLQRKILGNKKRNFLVGTQLLNALLALVGGKLIAEFISPEQFGLYNLQFAAFTFFFSLLINPTIAFIKASYQNLIPKIGLRPFFYVLSLLSILLYFSVIFFFT